MDDDTEKFEKFLKATVKEWDCFFSERAEDFARSQLLRHPDNPNRDWRSEFRIEFNNKIIESVSFTHRNFKRVSFNNSTFRNCVFRNCHFENGQFGSCVFIDSDFSGSVFKSFSINSKSCEGYNNFSKCTFSGSLQGILNNVDLSDSIIESVGAEGAKLIGVDLRRASLVGTRLAHTSWKNAKIDRFTNFTNVVFNKDHPVTRDDSEHIKFSWFGRHWLFNWMVVRAIGNLPIFEFSWVLFIFSLMVVNTIGFLNETKPVIFEGLNHIPIPENMIWIIVSTCLLAIGSTLYKLFCPEKIKSFTVTQWVYEHGHPRVEYLSEALQKPILQAITVILLIVGGAIGAWLILGRVFYAFLYLFGIDSLDEIMGGMLNSYRFW